MNRSKEVTDDEVSEARKRIKSLTVEKARKATALVEKIDRLEKAGMVTSAADYRRQLVRMTNIRSNTIDGQEDKPMTPQEMVRMRKKMK